ncbi:uncharacterized protein LOC114130571 [Aphis gossypii]|uniref:RlpA-like protein double-psi beta-barrel domain-containing protein n=1 Tax=Aphis gossypii TaxID=80765 RepID=A0A9P0ITF0_APHGO|nr:uncharacterized protein LOC114130571 [Aphis gossypii]CAH1716789.1 unnamed protein product [Aphis gossypii]
MKKSAGVFITLYLIFTISGIICDHAGSCKSINEVCTEDRDCCYQDCSFSIFYFQRYCKDNINAFSTLTSFFSSKAQIGMCSYKEPTDAEFSEQMYNKYGLNAGHRMLPPGTVVEVVLNDKKLMVTINDQPSNENGVILEFSKETAKVLDIKNGESLPCNMVVPRLENNQYIKYLKHILPYLSILMLVLTFF